MDREIVIRIGKEECTAELLIEEAPRTCERIRAALPLTGLLSHAKLVDREVFFQVPFFIDEMENLKRSEKGDLAFWNARQTLCIFFDDMVPLGPVSTFGRVTGNLEGLQRESAEVWGTPGKRITIEARARCAMQAALERIRAARQAIWLEPPADIARLRTKKGSRNQGASAVLYAAMKLGQLVTFLNHVRGVARQGGVELGTMKAVTGPLLESYAGMYGGFYQMTDAAELVREAHAALGEAVSLESYAELTGELSLYLGRLDYWVDLLIPWARFGEVYEETLR